MENLKGVAATIGFDTSKDDWMFQLAVAAAVLLVVLVVALIVFRRLSAAGGRRTAVVLVGRSGLSEDPGVGKTALFKQLRNGKQPPYGLVPSLVANLATIEIQGKSVELIDIPGMVPSLLENALERARCIVFVVDAAQVKAHARRDAEILHDVLTDDATVRGKVPVLVFCNKSDLMSSSSTEATKTYIERELQILRSSAVSAVETVGDDARVKPKHFLGFEEETFRFEHAVSAVTFAAGSALKGDVAAVEEFVARSF